MSRATEKPAPAGRVRSIVTAALLFFCRPGVAENTANMLMFGGDPGSPLAHSYSYGLPETPEPLYTLRVPVIDPTLVTVFYDTQLTISNPEKIVQRVDAARAYRTLAECDEARAIVAAKLAGTMPLAASAAGWERQSDDGRVAGRVLCERPRHYPMPVLRLELVVLP